MSDSVETAKPARARSRRRSVRHRRAPRPRIVVVGCGFGGLAAAEALAELPVDVTVVDRTNHHLFQPLLYQVSTAALAPTDIASPVRALVGRAKNVAVVLGEVTGVDVAARRVQVAGEPDLPYDTLVLATGSRPAWFGHDEWAADAAVLKTLPDALAVRRRVLSAFETAETSSDPAVVAAQLTFVVVGGGPTGVELAGSLAELARATLRSEYRHIDPASARIVLVDAGPRLLAAFSDAQSAYAQRALESLGVTVQLGAACEAIDAAGVVAGGTRIAAANVFWTAGTEAEPAAAWVGAQPAKGGTLPVGSDCTLAGHPEIFAIGDVASHVGADGHPLPALAAVAKQQGAYVAKLIGSRIGERGAPGPFRYRDLGTLAVIGRSRAVATIFGQRFEGRFAWLIWSLVHILLLIGFRNKAVVFLNWAWAWATYGRGARLLVEPTRRDDPRPAPGTSAADRPDGSASALPEPMPGS